LPGSNVAKRYTLQWSPVAQRDLDQIIEYLVDQDSIDAAVDLHDKILARIETLVLHPHRCRIPPELRKLGITEYRELIIPPYSVFIRIRGRWVGIVGVLDRRRDLEEVLLQRVLLAD
jgi:toxin ParE1/3/4